MKTNQRPPDAAAYLLLLAVGCLIAAMLPLSKMAMAAGVTPLAYAFWQSLGGAILLYSASACGHRPSSHAPCIFVTRW